MKDALTSEFSGLALNSSQYIHLVAEMEKRVFADRAEYLGDPAFVDVPIARLRDDAYIASRAAAVNPAVISPLVSVKPGVPNFYGVVGSTANEVEAGKRMLSSMSPTILLQHGTVSMVLGSPGGSTIISSVFETIVNILHFGLTPEQAVAAPRFHHQLLPPELITFSPGWPLPEETQTTLRARGYDPQPHPWEMGDVQVIWRSGDSYVPASDPRGRGRSHVIR